MESVLGVKSAFSGSAGPAASGTEAVGPYLILP